MYALVYHFHIKEREEISPINVFFNGFRDVLLGRVILAHCDKHGNPKTEETIIRERRVSECPSSIGIKPIESENGHFSGLFTRLSSFGSINSVSPLKIGSLRDEDEEEEDDRRRRGGFFQITKCCCCALFAAAIAAILLAALITAIVWLLMQPKVITTTTTTTTTSTTATTTTTTTATTTTSVTTSTTSTSATTTTTTTTATTTTSVTTSTTSTSATTTTTTTTATTSTSATTSTTSTSATTTTTATTSTSATTSTTSTATTATSTSTSTTTTGCTSCSNYCWSTTGSAVAGTSSTGISEPRGINIDSYDTIYLSGHKLGQVDRCPTNCISRNGTTNYGDHIDYMVFDKDGYMYTNDHDGNRVRRYAPGSSVGTVIAGAGSSVTGALAYPVGVEVDKNLNVYIGDRNDKKVFMLTPNATSLFTAINTGSTIAAMSALLLPHDSTSEIYISDQDGSKVFLWPFNQSSPRVTYTNVIGSPSTLNKPRGMKLDPLGNLYVADQENKRIVMYCVNSTNGIIVMNTNDKPVDLAFDSNMNLYTYLSTGKVIKHQLL
ncbi:hypothetical protein I4U23_016818 [Adineta vaga]|nr:hypothetical protein I4U23_016818 [Adineta vaga]